MIRKGHNISDTVFIVVSLRSFSGLASDECSLWKGLEVELRDVPALCNERVRALRAATGWPEPEGGRGIVPNQVGTSCRISSSTWPSVVTGNTLCVSLPNVVLMQISV